MEESQDLLEDILNNKLAHAIFTVFVFFIGACGNLLVVLVIVKQLEKLSSLNCFIASAAISDALSCSLHVANSLLDAFGEGWNFGDAACKLKSFLQMLFSNPPQTIIAAGLVVLLLRPQVSIQTSMKIVAAICVSTAVLVIPFGWYSETFTLESFDNRTYCVLDGDTAIMQFMIQGFYNVFHGGTLIGLFSLYISCGVLQKVFKLNLINDSRHNRILLITLLAFGVRWIPFQFWYSNRHDISTDGTGWTVKVINLCYLLEVGFNHILLMMAVDGFKANVMRLVNGATKQPTSSTSYYLLSIDT